MRAPALAFALLLVLVPFSVSSAGAEDFGAVGRVNKLIRVFETPQLAPGESGIFRFELNSTYTEPIFNVTLNASVYMYATIEESVPVDDTWSFSYPRFLESGGREIEWRLGAVQARNATPLNFTVLTAKDSRDMPHGSVFSQATYFVRFRLEFEGNESGSLRRYVMASRGFFTDEQWAEARNESNIDPCNPPWCRGNVNLTILGVDGLIPDSSFGVKEPIPQWPYYALIAAAAGFLILAFLFWVEENPGSYPRVEAWWARTRGRFARIRPSRRRPRERGD